MWAHMQPLSVNNIEISTKKSWVYIKNLEICSESFKMATTNCRIIRSTECYLTGGRGKGLVHNIKLQWTRPAPLPTTTNKFTWGHKFKLFWWVPVVVVVVVLCRVCLRGGGGGSGLLKKKNINRTIRGRLSYMDHEKHFSERYLVFRLTTIWYREISIWNLEILR